MLRTCAIGSLALAVLSACAVAESIQLQSIKDNTLYEDPTGSLSNGAGTSIFAGLTNSGSIRRALIQFDVSSVLPHNATIHSVSLTLVQDRNGPGGTMNLSIHQVLANWGEGASVGGGGGGLAMPGDATWIHRSHNSQFWTTPGGDFDSAELSAVEVRGLGPQVFTNTDDFAATVAMWAATPAQNFGLLVKSDTALSGQSARFFSREDTISSNRPTLSINYSLGPSEWISNADGAWEDSAAWSGGVPDSAGSIARFGSAISAPRAITLANGRTVGQIQFNSPNQYTIAGSGPLTIDNGPTTPGSIAVDDGSHHISVPLVLAHSTDFDISIGKSLAIDVVSGSSSAIVKKGGGALTLTDASLANLTINSGTVRLVSTLAAQAASLSVAPNGAFDLQAGGVMENAGANVATEYASRVADIVAGRIDSSLSMAVVGIAKTGELSTTSFMGRTLPSDWVAFRATLPGDTNLDATVNFDDLLSLAQNYGTQAGGRWTQGDSNYDGKIDFDDLLALAQQYALSLTQDGLVTVDSRLAESFAIDWQYARSLVPEPISILPTIALILCVRRRC